MDLYSLLLNIGQQIPVNFAQVVKKLPKTATWQNLFSAELVAKDKHLVTILDVAAFERLVLACEPATTRSQAAMHMHVSSHDLKCESAYMLCFAAPSDEEKGDVKAQRGLSVVAITQQSRFHLPFKARAKQAILIENQDCFFQWPRLLAHFEHVINLAQSDIYFSAGSRILNPAFNDLLSGYQLLNCVFDYDLAGLQTAAVLAQRKYAKTQYLVPDKLSTYQALFTFKPKSTKDLSSMLALCKRLGLSDLANIILQRKHFMEQEALLTID